MYNQQSTKLKENINQELETTMSTM